MKYVKRVFLPHVTGRKAAEAQKVEVGVGLADSKMERGGARSPTVLAYREFSGVPGTWEAGSADTAVNDGQLQQSPVLKGRQGTTHRRDG